MKQDIISDAIGLIDDEIIESTDMFRQNRQQKKNPWKRFAAMAACLCMAFGLAVVAAWQNAGNLDPSVNPLVGTEDTAELFVGQVDGTQPGKTQTQPVTSVTMPSSPSPLYLYSFEEVVEAKEEADPKKDTYGLTTLEYYYLPAYAERLRDAGILADGSINPYMQNVDVLYDSKEGGQYGYFEFTLQFNRDSQYAEALLANRIRERELKPFEGVEGIYYKDVYNPRDGGKLSLTQFFWIHDGYCFVMQVYPDVMDEIKKNDPEALKGPLFELQKIELNRTYPVSVIEPDETPKDIPYEYPSWLGTGGGDYDPFLLDYFVEPLENLDYTFFMNMGVNYEQLEYYYRNIVEPRKWDKQTLPYLYSVLKYFEIPREKFEEANKTAIAYNKEHEYPVITYEDWMIAALYCGDEQQMRLTLMNPNVLYCEVDDNFYNYYELGWMDVKELHALGFGADELTELFELVQSVLCGRPYGESEWKRFSETCYLERDLELLRDLEAGIDIGGAGDTILTDRYTDIVKYLDADFFELLGIGEEYVRYYNNRENGGRDNLNLWYAVLRFEIPRERFEEANRKAAASNR